MLLNSIVGILLIITAIVVALFGDKTVQDTNEGGFVLKAFSWPQHRSSLLKWPIGLTLAGFGLWVLIAGPL